MPDLILYHNPRWSKSRGAVSLLEEHSLDFSIVEYLKTPLTPSEIIALSEKLGKSPGEFVRKNEADFKNNNLAKQLNDDQKMAEAMAKFPKIMERPIAVKGDRAVIGRPLENVLSLLSWEKQTWNAS